MFIYIVNLVCLKSSKFTVQTMHVVGKINKALCDGDLHNSESHRENVKCSTSVSNVNTIR